MSRSAGSVAVMRRYDPEGFCELAALTLSYLSTYMRVILGLGRSDKRVGDNQSRLTWQGA